MLQPITIDGRAGQVMYLNDAWTPVDANEATLAKVLFEDGGSTFYTISQVEPRVAGGAGSGNFGHAGRPGEVGGSAPAMESSATTLRS